MLFRRVFNFLIVLSTLSFGQAAPAAAGDIEQQTGAQEAYQLAQTNTDDAEKDAFNSAKELGTSEAWQAYLKTYPTGFRADLARAYMKRLGEQGTAPASAPASGAALPPAGELACREAATLRSQNSATPAKVIFINASGAQRRIVWIDFKGSTKEYARLNAGEQLEQDTFLTHPWIVEDASGNCSQIFMPRSGTSLARLETGNSASERRQSDSEPAPKPKKVKRESEGCGKGKISVDGRCMKKEDAAGFCGPGYRLKGSKCVPGYKAPDPTAKRPAWQIEAIKKGCPAGMGWNAAEGCHEND